MAIQVIENKNYYVLNTSNAQYVFERQNDALKSLYWGEPLKNAADIPSDAENNRYQWDNGRQNMKQSRTEYTGWGSLFFLQPTLKATFADGVRDLDLRIQSISLSDDQQKLTCTLRDAVYPLEVDVIYEVYDGLEVLDRYAVIRNCGTEPIQLESVSSAAVNLPPDDHYQLTTMSGAWGREYTIDHQPITAAPVILDNRAGVSNAAHFPYFAIDKGVTTETAGEVWFGTIHWSGNWKMSVEKDTDGYVRIVGGLNDFDFSWKLYGGESFTAPRMTIGYSTEGYSGASRAMHHYIRKTTKATAWVNRPLPVLYNTWTAFEFDIEEENAFAQAERAAALGVELFVIDDGWFGKRDTDKCSLGDWYPSKTKFPNGLDPLINRVNELGMMFGIWVEPEMVNPDSDLYRAHPDWVINFPTRDQELSRHQLILNLAREDVYQFVIGFLDDLLSKHNIGYLKWDMNRYFSQPGWPEMPTDEQQKLWVRYVQNFYRVFEFLNEKYPNVLLENCASGGLRSDISMSKWCTRINRSDNQDPLDELYLHEGFTYVNLTRSAGGAGHISKNRSGINARECPMQFKAHIAMMGSMGIGVDLRELSDAEMEELRGYIQMQKELRETVQLGEMYRLRTMTRDGQMAVEFVSQDQNEAVVFLFAPHGTFKHVWNSVKLFGLDADAVYETDNGVRRTGDGWMKIGLNRELYTLGNMSSRVIRLHKIK